MAKLKNVNPLGDVEIVGVGDVKAGAVFEVPVDVAEVLLEQVGNYEAVKSEPKK